MSFNPNGNQVSPLNRQSEGYGMRLNNDSFYGAMPNNVGKNSIISNSDNDYNYKKEKSSNG